MSSSNRESLLYVNGPLEFNSESGIKSQYSSLFIPVYNWLSIDVSVSNLSFINMHKVMITVYYLMLSSCTFYPSPLPAVHYPL